MTQIDESAVDPDDEMIAVLSDYVDGTLPADKRAEVDKKLASDEAWKTAHAEILETRNALSGLQKARAPVTFTEDVTGTIHKRSAGRFFAKRTFGDRVPFGAILIVALLGLAVIAYIMWSSPTGSLKREKEREHRTGSALVPKI
jgi:anti-sigma factor RsiW